MKPANATEALRECPREPTEEMLFAANHGYTPDETHRRMWTSVWQVMFDNAPVLAAEPPKEVAALLADAEIPSTKTLSEQLRGFAAYCESVGRGEGFDKDDCTMFAKKFREAADALARLAAPVPDKEK